MRILIISPFLPYPIKSGGAQAVFNMVNYLQHYMDVHFLYQTKSLSGDGAIKKSWTKVKLHPFYAKRSFQSLTVRLGLKFMNRFFIQEKGYGWLQSASNYFLPDFLEFVKDTILKEEPDLVQTEFYNCVDLVYALPVHVKKVFIQHEIHYVINAQRLSGGNLSVHKQFAFQKLKVEEIAAMNQYDSVFTLTENDKMELFENGVVVPIYSSPAGIEQPKERNKCIFENKLIFVGTSGHYPNYEGIKWFIDNVWEIIEKRHPEIKLNIIGKWDRNYTESICAKSSNIVFKGFVPDLQEEYKGAIAIVPILQGSGMRMKIIDAVNFGSPFVSTTIGVEGLEYKNGEDCFIADEPSEFAQRIIELVESQDLRQRFYDHSALVRDEYYSMDALARRRMELYKKVVMKK